MLEPLLESHAPIDLCILMLGTNDIASSYHLTASDIACGCLALICTVEKSQAGPAGGPPEILLIAPPFAGQHVGNNGTLLRGQRENFDGAAESLQDGGWRLRVPLSRCLKTRQGK